MVRGETMLVRRPVTRTACRCAWSTSIAPMRLRPTHKILILVAGAMLLLLVLAFIPPRTAHLYWVQAYIFGRTDEGRSNVIPPPAGYTGKWYTWHRNLTLDSEMDYRDGKVHGRWTRRDPRTGHIWWSGYYEGNVARGDWFWYRPDGTVSAAETGGGYYEPIGGRHVMLFWLTWDR